MQISSRKSYYLSAKLYKEHLSKYFTFQKKNSVLVTNLNLSIKFKGHKDQVSSLLPYAMLFANIFVFMFERMYVFGSEVFLFLAMSVIAQDFRP